MKHAASVRPEPGSNSPLSESLCPSIVKGLLNNLLDFVFVLTLSRSSFSTLTQFSVLRCLSFFEINKYLVVRLTLFS